MLILGAVSSYIRETEARGRPGLSAGRRHGRAEPLSVCSCSSHRAGGLRLSAGSAGGASGRSGAQGTGDLLAQGRMG